MGDQQTNIVPFGKYKGRPIEEVLLDDPGYLQWLSGQAWFRDKFAVLYQVIINRGGEPEETPEHNALQVKFLSLDFCLRVFECALGFVGYEKDARQDLERAFRDAGKPESEIGDIGFKVMERDFESEGADVVLRMQAYSKRHPDLVPSIPYWRSEHRVWNDERSSRREFKIELKPTVGDDYPAVLRQMKRNGSTILFLSEYRGQGASEDDFIRTFEAAGMSVVFARDVDAGP
jgi:hypothetical protein